VTLDEVRLEPISTPEAGALWQRLGSACGSRDIRLSLFHLEPRLEWFVGDLVAVFNTNLSPLVNRVSTTTGFHALQAPEGWSETDRQSARWIVTMVLWRDLAYAVEELPWREASALAHEFFRVVAGDGHPRARYFTNGEVFAAPPSTRPTAGRCSAGRPSPSTPSTPAPSSSPPARRACCGGRARTDRRCRVGG
jgi:hypothetical protein